MPELRWTLLILGGLFILGLALWEIRRQRQAPRQNGSMSAGPSSDRVAPTLDGGARGGADGGPGGAGSFGGAVGGFGGAGRGFGGSGGDPSESGGGFGATGSASGGADAFSTGLRAGGGFADSGRSYREPIITLPELHPADPRGESRTARRDPPVVEVDDASFSRLQVEGETGTRDPEAAYAEDTIAISADDLDPGIVDAVAAHMANSSSAHGVSGAPTTSESRDPTASETPDFAAPASGVSTSREANQAPPPESVGFSADTDGDTDDSHTPESPREAHPAGATANGAPVVEWPTEESRKIIALRLVSAPAARFPGRAVRQALAAEGFVLGKFDIFHKAGPDDRAILSAASLTKPGTFTMSTIDAQRFGGLSLFAVLPGPLSPQETFDELLSTARNLNSRLQGALQDERGEPLTPMRSASIRQSLSEGNGSSDHGEGAGSQSETRQ